MFDGEELPRIRPYWDPRLRTEGATRIRFFKRLTEIGLGTHKRGIRGAIGMFFLRKKDGRQRMVIDARPPNAMHRRPPGTELSTPGALAGLDLNAEVGEHGVAPDFYASSVGLVDSFYQFEDEDLSPWFGCPWPETASTWGVTHIAEAAGAPPTPVQKNDYLYFCFKGMPMGWTWALHFCQQAMQSAVARALPPSEDGFGGVILDGSPPPRVRRGAPVAGVYVDNALIIAASREECQSTSRSSTRSAWSSMPSKGRRSASPSWVWTSTSTLRNTTKRAWRLYLSCHALVKIGGSTSWSVEVFALCRWPRRPLLRAVPVAAVGVALLAWLRAARLRGLPELRRVGAPGDWRHRGVGICLG